MTVTALWVVCLLVATSCGQQSAEQSPQAKAQVGVILPLTGEASSYGVDCRKGIELAAAQAGDKVQFIFEDSKADPKQAVTAIQRLINQRHVTAIIGDMFSSTTLAIAPIAQQNDIVLVTPTAAAVDIPATGDNIFTIYPSSEFEGEFMAQRSIERGVQTTGILIQQVQAAEEIGAAFSATAAQLGIRIVYTQRFPEGTRDFRSIIASMKAQPVDAVFISAYGQEACSFLQQARELGLPGLVLSQSTLYDQKLLDEFGAAMEGVLFSAPFYTEDAETSEIARFRTAYNERFESSPTVWAAYGYDVAQLMISALSKQQDTNQSLNEIVKATAMNGPTGPLSFGDNRMALRNMRLFTVKNGKFSAVQD